MKTIAAARLDRATCAALVAAVLMPVALGLIFFYVPNDADQGFSQRIFYFHVPIAMTTYALFAWGALNRDADTSFEAFFSTPAYTPGATYRLLRVADGKVGMYEMIKHRGRLDSEFFPESIDRRSWPDTEEYAQFLRKRRVDYVVIFDNYDARYHTNEHDLLDVLVSGGGASGFCAARIARGEGYTVYRAGACEPV